MIPARAFRSVERSRENARMYLELEIGSEGLITGYTESTEQVRTWPRLSRSLGSRKKHWCNREAGDDACATDHAAAASPRTLPTARRRTRASSSWECSSSAGAGGKGASKCGVYLGTSSLHARVLPIAVLGTGRDRSTCQPRAERVTSCSDSMLGRSAETGGLCVRSMLAWKSPPPFLPLPGFQPGVATSTPPPSAPPPVPEAQSFFFPLCTPSTATLLCPLTHTPRLTAHCPPPGRYATTCDGHVGLTVVATNTRAEVPWPCLQINTLPSTCSAALLRPKGIGLGDYCLLWQSLW